MLGVLGLFGVLGLIWLHQAHGSDDDRTGRGA